MENIFQARSTGLLTKGGGPDLDTGKPRIRPGRRAHLCREKRFSKGFV